MLIPTAPAPPPIIIATRTITTLFIVDLQSVGTLKIIVEKANMDKLLTKLRALRQELKAKLLKRDVAIEAALLALDTKRRLVTAPITVAIGTNDAVPVHPREIFRSLIKVAASSRLIAHLHPSSGEPVPSPDDVMMTTRLREAGELLGIPVVDHIVLGRGCYISMAERRLM
jgi:DNA repair protein RadC